MTTTSIFDSSIRNFDVDLNIPPGLTINLAIPLVSYQVPINKRGVVTRVASTLEPTIKPRQLHLALYASFHIKETGEFTQTRIYRHSSGNVLWSDKEENVYPYSLAEGTTVSIHAQNLDSANTSRSIEADFQILEVDI
jgi:hypothetical protein